MLLLLFFLLLLLLLLLLYICRKREQDSLSQWRHEYHGLTRRTKLLSGLWWPAWRPRLDPKKKKISFLADSAIMKITTRLAPLSRLCLLLEAHSREMGEGLDKLWFAGPVHCHNHLCTPPSPPHAHPLHPHTFRVTKINTQSKAGTNLIVISYKSWYSLWVLNQGTFYCLLNLETFIF